MDKKAELKAVGKKITHNYLSEQGMPMKAFSGSLGDRYGYVHDNSDIDIEVWVTDQYFKKGDKEPVVNWEPCKWRWKTRCPWASPPMDIDVVADVEGKYDASVAFLYIVKNEVPAYMESLVEGLKASEPADYHSPMDFALRHFVETELIDDQLGIYDTVAQGATKVFDSKRQDYAKGVLDKGRLRFVLRKLEDDNKIIKNGGSIDITQYNRKATEAIDLLTYGACCVKNIPRSYSSIEWKRKTELWKALNMDQKQINEIMLSSDNYEIDKVKVQNSIETLKDMINEFYEQAKKEFSNFNMDTISFLR